MTSPHFCIRCPCGILAAFVVSPAQIDQDPVQILRSLPSNEQEKILVFYAAHEDHGALTPCLMDIQPMARA